MTTATKLNKGNIRVYIRKGYSDKRYGITPNMEVGFIYHVDNKVEELEEVSWLIGINQGWIQDKVVGMAYYLVWGGPLKSARKLFKCVARDEVVKDNGRIIDSIRDELKTIEAEVKKEWLKNEPIINDIGYVHFFSRSKGRRFIKSKNVWVRRPRTVWREIDLFRYCGGGWHIEKKFPFDEIVDEVTEGRADLLPPGPLGVDGGKYADDLVEYVKAHCNKKGGGR